MNIDFQAFMVLALLVSGIIWAADAWFFAPRREQSLAGGGKEPVLVDYARSFFPVILIVLLLRSFLVEPFRIPSGSMMPTLLNGDFILVNKFAYGLRLPLLGTKLVEINEPARGDVVVFRFPGDPSVDYIKRVIGLPGDRVTYYRDRLTINGEPVAQMNKGSYAGTGVAMSMSGVSLRQETIDGVVHDILEDPRRYTREGEYIVPEGEYFVMGDNRDNSNDGRFWGTVPEANLVGKAFLIWMNWDSVDGSITWGRLGQSIK
jgi:signal peptidase I